jgi:hypothetical protein
MSGYAQASDLAVVRVRSTKPHVSIGEVTERHAFTTQSVGFAGRSPFIASGVSEGVSWRPLGIAPCRFQLSPGSHELVVDGPTYRRRIIEVELSPGVNDLLVKPGELAYYILGWAGVVAGLSSAVIGSISLAGGRARWRPLGLGLVLGGTAATALGVWGVIAGLSTIERNPDSTRPESVGLRRAPVGLQVARSF